MKTWITHQQWDSALRRIEKQNIKTNGHTLAAASMSNLCHDLIIEVDEKSMLVKENWRAEMRARCVAPKEAPELNAKPSAQPNGDPVHDSILALLTDDDALYQESQNQILTAPKKVEWELIDLPRKRPGELCGFTAGNYGLHYEGVDYLITKDGWQWYGHEWDGKKRGECVAARKTLKEVVRVIKKAALPEPKSNGYERTITATQSVFDALAWKEERRDDHLKMSDQQLLVQIVGQVQLAQLALSHQDNGDCNDRLLTAIAMALNLHERRLDS